MSTPILDSSVPRIRIQRRDGALRSYPTIFGRHAHDEH
jgi:hypothetical protein